MWIDMKHAIISRCCEMYEKKKPKYKTHCANYVPMFYVFSLLFSLKVRVGEQ